MGYQKSVRPRGKLKVKRVMFDFSLACRCEVSVGTDFGTQKPRKIEPEVMQNQDLTPKCRSPRGPHGREGPVCIRERSQTSSQQQNLPRLEPKIMKKSA